MFEGLTNNELKNLGINKLAFNDMRSAFIKAGMSPFDTIVKKKHKNCICCKCGKFDEWNLALGEHSQCDECDEYHTHDFDLHYQFHELI